MIWNRLCASCLVAAFLATGCGDSSASEERASDRGRGRGGPPAFGAREAAATAVLKQQNIRISSIRRKDREIPFLPPMPTRIQQKRVSLFTRQFSVMLDAGLPLVQCLEILGEQQEHPKFAQILTDVRTDVESGASLADAMRKQPAAFDDLYVNMVAAGESGGILDIILQRLSTYMEKAVKLKGQVKSALIYPVAVLVIAVGWCG